MTLTTEQLHAVASGHEVRFEFEGVKFVVLRSEEFDKAKTILDSDHQELRAMLARSSAVNGWDEPGMDSYDSYPDKR